MERKSTSKWYDKFCSEHGADLPLFFHGWYLDAVCGDGLWGAAAYTKDQQVLAIWPYYMKSKYGLSYITMPSLTPYLGPWIPDLKAQKNHKRYGYEHAAITQLCEDLPSVHFSTIHTHPDLDNLLAARWKGHQEKTRYTYRLALGDPDEIWNGISDKQRNTIRKAQSTLTVSESDDIDLFYTFNKKSFKRQGLQIPYSHELIKNLDQALSMRSQRTMLVAKDQSNNVHGMIYLAYDQQTVYLLAIGSDPQWRSDGSIPLLIWHAIQQFSGSHLTFDFEGSMIPNIEKFFRSFGGQLTPYSRLFASKHIGVDLLLTLTGRYG
jgi:lipid II:glycine glycyltransferase (peptidoglycan interpeptide bridge formation enzyme)